MEGILMSDENVGDLVAMPPDKLELLRRIRRDWSALLRFLEDKDETGLSRSKPGHWSIKDNLVHLAFWEKFLLLHHLQRTPAHLVLEVDPAELHQLGEDGFNRLIWERSQKRSLADVLRDLHETHARLMLALEAVEFEALREPDRIDTLIPRPLLESVVCNTYEHYQEHLATLQREWLL
jgi:hypothetical protein